MHVIIKFTSHFQSLFKDFIKEILNKDFSLSSNLITQLKNLNNIDVAKKSKGCLDYNLPNNPTQTWAMHILASIKHQLATIFILHGSPSNPCSKETLIQLLQMIQVIKSYILS